MYFIIIQDVAEKRVIAKNAHNDVLQNVFWDSDADTCVIMDLIYFCGFSVQTFCEHFVKILIKSVISRGVGVGLGSITPRSQGGVIITTPGVGIERSDELGCEIISKPTQAAAQTTDAHGPERLEFVRPCAPKFECSLRDLKIH